MKRSDSVHAVIMTICMILIMLASSTQAHASSGYTISQKAAEHYAVEAAHLRYNDGWGVVASAAFCRPQFVNPDSNWRRYTWHRWTCSWGGYDAEGDPVYGSMRITGHSNGTFGYMPVNGGLKWGWA
jgi:hypothetical protein